MRTIKFRGKRVDNGKWVYGYLHLPFGNENIMIQVSNTDSYGVIPESVGQFTDLTDKNGKEIYEGDIVDFNNRIQGISKVVFENGGFMADAKNYETAFTYRVANHARVIGNIHDNPELLNNE